MDSDSFFQVTAMDRARRFGHPGMVVWFTGLSGAGKTTLATQLERILFDQGRAAYLLDGDILRTGLCQDLGFSIIDRRENVRRAGEVARVLADAGFIVLAAFISPFALERDQIRAKLPPRRFVEVYVNTSVETCEKRDVKGLYRKARANLIPDFTGISSPYEPPISPELKFSTDQTSIERCLIRLQECIENRLQPCPE
ncbi:MAG: adenylyl-sulfate kinase [Pedosphaera sp.]|nr:adenylyl-sulfate kinase [Pedosphaera sp.]